MSVAWTGRLDDRYDCRVDYVLGGGGYVGTLVVTDIATGEELLRESTTIAYAARFGADVADDARWTARCVEVVDAQSKSVLERDEKQR